MSRWTVYVVLANGQLGSVSVVAKNRGMAITKAAKLANVHRDCVADVQFNGTVQA